MTLRTGIVIFVAVALLCTACSEEKKREAARLAARLNGDTLTTQDSLPMASDSSLDSVVIDSTNAPASSAYDSPSQDVDSPVLTDQTAAAATDTFNQPASTQPVETPQDTVIPDVNAIPAENGRRTPASMPRYIEDAYTVQVASSTDQMFSQQIVDTFLARGYDAYLGTVTRDGTTYYRVRVGRYATSTEANRVATELNQKYSLQSWVDKITK